MAGRQRRDATFDPVTIGTEDAARDGVSIVRAASGRMAFVPRSVERLRGEALEVATEIQEVVARIREDQLQLERLVLEGRECGLSWAAVGWCVGTTGDGARKRWGES